MEGVLTRQVCAASAAHDMVGLKLGAYQFLMYYQTAFKMAAGTLQSSKLASRFEGVRPESWTKHVEHLLVPQLPIEPQHREYRRSKGEPNFETWKVAFERNLVIFTFDNDVIHMHYEDAFALYGHLRLAAKNAKRWAGDRGKQWSTRAHLADAEVNDKFVYTS